MKTREIFFFLNRQILTQIFIKYWREHESENGSLCLHTDKATVTQTKTKKNRYNFKIVRASILLIQSEKCPQILFFHECLHFTLQHFLIWTSWSRFIEKTLKYYHRKSP